MNRNLGVLLIGPLFPWLLQRRGCAATKWDTREPKAEVVDMPPAVPEANSILATPVSVNPKEAKAQRPLNDSGPSGNKIPEFALKDPLGKVKHGEKLYGECGMLIMLTVPNLSQYEKQTRWQKVLKKEKWPEQFAPTCVVLEDLSQQVAFKERARAAIKERCATEPSNVVVLIDEDGAVRRKFGVQENETVIFLVDASGRILHQETDDAEPGPEAARRIMGQVARMAATQAQDRAAPPMGAAVVLAAGMRKP